MKKVVPNDQVAHLWANKSQASARSSNGNFYFDGDTIYSYGGHFPIARHVTNERGEAAILLTSRGYSKTTAMHITRVRRAIGYNSSLPMFHVDHPRDGHSSIVDGYIKRRDFALSMAKNARQRKARLFQDAQELDQELRAYSRFFDLVEPAPLPDDMEAAILAAAEARKAEEAKREQAAAEALAKRIAANAERRTAWIAGEGNHYRSEWSEAVALRVSGDELETSMGAIVPLADAVAIFRLACIAKQHGHRIDGEKLPEDKRRVGSFTLDHISPQGDIRAGCHLIEFAEAERVAALIGVTCDQAATA